MTLLAVLRDGRQQTCDSRCWGATTQPCRCPCGGLLHGVGAEEAARLIASLDLASMPGVIVMPELPFAAERAAESLVVTLEPVVRVQRRARSSATRCDGCGLPWGEVVLFAMVEAGRLCDGCVRRLWRAS